MKILFKYFYKPLSRLKKLRIQVVCDGNILLKRASSFLEGKSDMYQIVAGLCYRL
ncbi:MAG: hypothetical protein LBQ98_10430 [Nitrososphaerota archaeon]|nr:hypothetical protein [Nitrososphaerota archaeon]